MEQVEESVEEQSVQDAVMEAVQNIKDVPYYTTGHVYYLRLQRDGINFGVKDMNLIFNNRYCDQNEAFNRKEFMLDMLNRIQEGPYSDMFVHYYIDRELLQTHNILLFDEPDIRLSEYKPSLDESYEIAKFILNALKILHEDFKYIHERLSPFVICKYGDRYRLDIQFIFDDFINASTLIPQYGLSYFLSDEREIDFLYDIASACIIMLEIFLGYNVLVHERRDKLLRLQHSHKVEKKLVDDLSSIILSYPDSPVPFIDHILLSLERNISFSGETSTCSRCGNNFIENDFMKNDRW